MFADLDQTIRDLLIQDVPLDLAEVDISFEAPDREWSARLSRPTINCYLYDIRENLELRALDWEVAQDRGNGNVSHARLPIRVDATYNISVWARAPEDEHGLLWRVLSVLASHATLSDDITVGALRGQPFAIATRVAQPDHIPTSAADLWQAVDNRMRPSLTYVATLPLDLAQVLTAPMVFTRVARTQPTESPSTNNEAVQIGGLVLNRGEPVSGASVRTRGIRAVAISNADGRFVLSRVPLGPLELVVAYEGRERTHNVTVPSARYDLEV